MAFEVGTGAAAGVAAEAVNKHIVAPLMQRIDDLIHLDRNTRSLQLNLERLKPLLQDISNAFENDKKRPADSIAYCLQRMDQTFGEATRLTASQGDQSFLGSLKFSRQVTEMKTKFEQLFQDLLTDLQIFLTAQQIVSAAPSQGTNVLLQPVPEGGFVGSVIESAKNQLQTWITGKAPQDRVIGVYGMAGVGKTSLLRSVYNFYKVSKLFDVVIWVTVSRDYTISGLQRQIAEAINLDLSSTSNTDTQTMNLSASLKNKKFLLFLDDIWNALDLQELGVAFGTDKGSKVVFSTRNRDLASAEADKSTEVKPLSMEQGWELFQRVAFKGGPVPEDLKDCARQIADECEGLPLAITVVAAAMRGKKKEVEWNTSLSLMKIADPAFPDTHPRVAKELYQKLRWSYDDLPTYLQNCFLDCALFPEDHQILVEELVQMWIAEGVVKSKEATHSMDMELGLSYVKLLIDSGLFQNGNFEKQSNDIIVNKPVNVWKWRRITVHDVIRDMAIYIGEKEDNYVCRAGQGLKDFPVSPSRDCKRMSLHRNQIEHLPNDLVCTQLVSLILSRNPLPCNIPESFLMNLTSLRVLDLSLTSIQSVPTSLGQLRLLEYLSLRETQIKELPEEICNLSELQVLNLIRCRSLSSLPEEICNLSKLQVLDLPGCSSLSSLPCMIGKLTQLQCLYLCGCTKLVLPVEISQLTSLKTLEVDIRAKTDVMALKGLTNLIQLYLHIYLEPHEMMGTWLETRHLWLDSRYASINDLIPSWMRNMKKLQSLRVQNMSGLNLPNCICEFQQLQRLELRMCHKVEELTPLERLPNLKYLKLQRCIGMSDLGIGSGGNPVGFPMLERLDLIWMENLQSMGRLLSAEGVLKEGSLPQLCALKIRYCRKLQKLPRGIEKLPNLKALYGDKNWWDDILWEDNNVKVYLHKLFIEI